MANMVEVNAALVKQLREKTGAGINDCKKALQENSADLKKAEEWLRSKGVKVEKLSRATGEGALVAKVSADGRTAELIELRCETDFSARNANFLKLASEIAEAALKAGTGEPAAIQKLAISDGRTVEAAINQEMTLGVRENVKLEHAELKKLDGAGRVGTYIHSNGKLAVLVGVKAPNDAAAKHAEFETLAKDIAMHVAGRIPAAIAVDRASFPKDVVDGERKVLLAQMEQDPKDAKKPQQIKDKIVDGKMNKFFEERVLLEQKFVKDEEKTIQQLLDTVGKSIGGTPTVAWFVRRQLGG